ncbi:hypothetical protein [Pseudonocardia sp. N23]|uniref:hypothetical protein n=1 Tax=Pseudonocardia sp. N23 TaxID=1987376 RepID=UPI000BFB558E|nr:hypothetical protein [Pseudonocardia sp. N23]GAY11834.1 hypothetical protein TOK_0219 [Pseudonocardia sp. N23]
MTELPIGADGYLDMDSVPDVDLDESETADLFDEPDPVPDAVWSRMLSTAVTDTDADVDDLVPPPGAGPTDPGHDVDPVDVVAGHEVHYTVDANDRYDGHVDAGAEIGHDGSRDAGHDSAHDAGHDGVHDGSWHDGSWHDGGWHDGGWHDGGY